MRRFPFSLTATPLLAALLLLLGSAPARATLLISDSAAADLIGGQVLVLYDDQGGVGAPIVSDGAGGAMASVTDFFTFHVPAGDTFAVDWSLSNDRINFFVTDLIMDLTGSVALFDSGVPEPGSPDGSVGLGATQTSAGPPAIVGFVEFDPWTDPMNAGDMYAQERISFENLRGGLSITWSDDTDRVVPEPGTLLLLGCGVVGLAARRGRALR